MIRKAPKIFSPYVFIIKCGSLFKPMPYKVLSVLFILLGVLSNSFATPATTMPDDESFILPNPKYHSNEDIGTIFKNLQDQYPHLARTYIIGKSMQDRPLHALAVTASSKDYKERDLLKPFVKFTANIHGDETLGREIILNLAQYLVLNYAKVPEVQQILNTTEIHMLPTCNPDGFYAAHEGNCESLPDYVGRNNAAGEDLNRDFPDRLDNEHHAQLRTEKRQPETAAVIDFTLSKPFILSANFHGGAVVAGYPYDNSIAHHECCEESLAPDDVVFKHLAHAYADNHPSMRLGNSCNETFPGGITNGAKWYELDGGMQDFNYVFANCFELTIELTCCKYPLAVTLPDEWASNKRSLVTFVKQAHIGIKGLVKDVNGYPIHDARIVVSGFEGKTVRTTQRGEFWRLLVPGIYDVQAMAFGFQNSEVQKVEVTNDNAAAQRVDFTLSPISNNIDGISSFYSPYFFRH